ADVERRVAELSRGPLLDAISRLGAIARTSGWPLEPVSPGETQEELNDGGAPASFRVPQDSARSAVRRGLPPLEGPLFGRDEDRRRLSSLVESGARLVNVWGGPGVGKSRLVPEVTRELLAAAALR